MCIWCVGHMVIVWLFNFMAISNVALKPSNMHHCHSTCSGELGQLCVYMKYLSCLSLSCLASVDSSELFSILYNTMSFQKCFHSYCKQLFGEKLKKIIFRPCFPSLH